MKVHIEFEPGEETAVIAYLTGRLGPPVLTGDDLAGIVHRVAFPPAGADARRMAFLRAVALAGDSGLPKSVATAAFDSARSFGGTRSAIERTWQASGQPGAFIDQTADGRFVMRADARPLVLALRRAV